MLLHTDVANVAGSAIRKKNHKGDGQNKKRGGNELDPPGGWLFTTVVVLHQCARAGLGWRFRFLAADGYENEA